MTSPHLLDMHLLFNCVDTTDESTQPEARYLRELFATIIIIVILITIIMTGGKDENGKLNDLEYVADKKHNMVANRNRKRNDISTHADSFMHKNSI